MSERPFAKEVRETSAALDLAFAEADLSDAASITRAAQAIANHWDAVCAQRVYGEVYGGQLTEKTEEGV